MRAFDGALDVGLRWMRRFTLLFHISGTFIFIDVSVIALEMWSFVAKSKPYTVCGIRMALRSNVGVHCAMWFNDRQAAQFTLPHLAALSLLVMMGSEFPFNARCKKASSGSKATVRT
jgi:hypothetical protein